VSGKQARGRYVFDTLVSVARRTQPRLISWLGRRGIEVRSFRVVNALAMDADAATLITLARDPLVARIYRDAPVGGAPTHAGGPAIRNTAATQTGSSQVASRLPHQTSSRLYNSVTTPVGELAIESNLLAIHAERAWSAGFLGQSTVVAIADTGVYWQHPGLQASYRGASGPLAGHDYNWFDPVQASASPLDDHGHGTHVAGIVVGAEAERRYGAAPQAQWIACKNMRGSDGAGTPSTYLACMDWFLAPTTVEGSNPRPDLAPDIVNNSWACPPEEGCAWDTLRAAVEALRAAGIVFVAAAGNGGSRCGSVSAPPGIYDAVLSVGNFDHRAGLINRTSSRGPVTVDGSGRLKPDLVAPGTSISSTLSTGGYGLKTGTSMAAPHVAGAVALLWSARPALRGDVDRTEATLLATAVARPSDECDAAGTPNNTWGHGVIDIWAAITDRGDCANEDVDCSCLVDMADVQAVADRWDTSIDQPDPDADPSTPNYEVVYDIDRDGRIDVFDVLRVIHAMGRTCR
jgi:subtilisin family serine protease